MVIKIEKVSTGYHLYVDDYFINGYKTESALQAAVAERIRRYLQ